LVLSFDINFLCAGLIWNLGDRGAFLLVLGPPIKRDGYVGRYKTGASENLSATGDEGGGKSEKNTDKFYNYLLIFYYLNTHLPIGS